MLRYALEQAPYEEKLLEIAERTGKIPPKIANKPYLTEGLELYWQAYLDLIGDKNGMGGPIPWTAMHAWAKHHELDSRQTDDLVYLLRELDGFHAQWNKDHPDK